MSVDLIQPKGRPASHPDVRFGKVGVLLVNLGTPDGTGYWDMRRYLSEFLSDRRVIEMSPLLWQPILQGIILSIRPSKSGRAYRSIWMEETDESPLRFHTRRQSEALAAACDDSLQVEWAMRYGRPSIAERLASLQAAGCDRIAVVALYPQYSATTSATVYDEVFRTLQKLRWQPALRTAAPFHDDPVYIGAIARSIERQIAANGWTPQTVLLSFHGLPQSYFDKGDPYYCHCSKTARLVREVLAPQGLTIEMSFQSRFGPQAWLQPYTDDRLRSLPGEGTQDLLVVTPGFIADCVETLEEIGDAGRELFLGSGGRHFDVVPCLNDSDLGLDLLRHLVERETAGWIMHDQAII